MEKERIKTGHSTRHDVIVVGAGPGGSASAYFLACQGLNVLLLDKADFPRDKTCGDALTPRAVAMLADMGVLPAVKRAACLVRGFEIHAPNGYALKVPIPVTAHAPNYALVVPRLTLDNLLRERALAGGAQFHSPVHVTGIETTSNGTVVHGKRAGRAVTYRARLAVVATGANTRLLQASGILTQTPRMVLAARAYYEGFRHLPDSMQFHFANIPLPGYGWVFPISGTAANVGAGVFPSRRRLHSRKQPSAQAALDALLQGAPIQALLNGARRVGPVKGYPLRVDFATAPTYAERVLLVGEAAGLVNPLTGEGIDYALESGQLAADFIGKAFSSGNLSRAALAEYDRRLRARYQRLFVFSTRVRDLGTNRLSLNLLVRWADRRDDLRTLLTNIMLGNHVIPERITVGKVLQVLRAQ